MTLVWSFPRVPQARASAARSAAASALRRAESEPDGHSTESVATFRRRRGRARRGRTDPRFRHAEDETLDGRVCGAVLRGEDSPPVGVHGAFGPHDGGQSVRREDTKLDRVALGLFRLDPENGRGVVDHGERALLGGGQRLALRLREAIRSGDAEPVAPVRERRRVEDRNDSSTSLRTGTTGRPRGGLPRRSAACRRSGSVPFHVIVRYPFRQSGGRALRRRRPRAAGRGPRRSRSRPVRDGKDAGAARARACENDAGLENGEFSRRAARYARRTSARRARRLGIRPSRSARSPPSTGK